MPDLKPVTPLDVPIPTNDQKIKNSKIRFYLVVLAIVGVMIVVSLVAFYLGRLSVQSKLDNSTKSTEVVASPVTEATVSPEMYKEVTVLPSTGFCGQINDIWALDFPTLNESCDISLVREVDDKSLELSYIRNNNIGLETALFTFDYPVDIESSKIASIDLNLENVFCNGSVSILYSSNDGYKKWTRFKNSTDFYSCGQGGSDIKNIKLIAMHPDFVNNQVKIVFTPYASAFPFSVDKVYLVVKYRS